VTLITLNHPPHCHSLHLYIGELILSYQCITAIIRYLGSLPYYSAKYEYTIQPTIWTEWNIWYSPRGNTIMNYNIPRFWAASSASRLRSSSCACSFFSRASRAALSLSVSGGFTASIHYMITCTYNQVLLTTVWLAWQESGLWHHPLNGNWQPEPTSSLPFTDFWCQLVASLAVETSRFLDVSCSRGGIRILEWTSNNALMFMSRHIQLMADEIAGLRKEQYVYI